jgi:hypothetical protein
MTFQVSLVGRKNLSAEIRDEISSARSCECLESAIQKSKMATR